MILPNIANYSKDSKNNINCNKVVIWVEKIRITIYYKVDVCVVIYSIGDNYYEERMDESRVDYIRYL